MTDENKQPKDYHCIYCEQSCTEEEMFFDGGTFDICNECADRISFLRHAKYMDEKRRKENEEFYRGLES